MNRAILDPAPLGERAGMAQCGGMAMQEVAFDRNDDIRNRQIIVRLRAFEIVAGQRRVLVPPGPRETIEETVDFAEKGG